MNKKYKLVVAEYESYYRCSGLTLFGFNLTVKYSGRVLPQTQ